MTKNLEQIGHYYHTDPSAEIFIVTGNFTREIGGASRDVLGPLCDPTIKLSRITNEYYFSMMHMQTSLYGLHNVSVQKMVESYAESKITLETGLVVMGEKFDVVIAVYVRNGYVFPIAYCVVGDKYNYDDWNNMYLLNVKFTIGANTFGTSHHCTFYDRTIKQPD